MSGGYYYQKDVGDSASLLHSKGDGMSGKRHYYEYEESSTGSLMGVLRRNMFKVCMVAAVAAAFFALVSYNSSSSTPSDGVLDSTDATMTKYSFGASKKFSITPSITVTSPGYGTISSLSLLPWDAIAEPAKEQEISISITDSVMGTAIPMSENDLTATWTIAGSTYTGTTTSFQVDETGVYDCTVQVYYSASSRKNKLYKQGVLQNLEKEIKNNFPSVSSEVQRYFGADGSTSYTFTFTLAVKYVRREIRTLSENDREKVFDAMLTLYKTNQTEGEALYGSKYISIETFMYYHLSGAGSSDCDHWHDGAGILTHHAAITLAFEQSLQAIDSSIALPYWEYAMDDILYDEWYYSPIFYSTWLGEANPSTSDHSITTSRFAGVEMPDGTSYTAAWSIADEGSLSPYSNPYGYMRTPWNLNKSPYFGRYNKTYNYESYTTFPGCTTLQMCYDHDDLADVSLSLSLSL
jgi:hypothetical protein